MTGARPLTGRSVLELANWITGPMTAQLLAQLGADVTKVEAPGGDPFRQWPDGRPSPRFATYSRGKRSAVLDLTTSDGREAVHRLMAGADIVVMALRPDAAAALGVDYASLGPINPSAIFCDLTGFGPEPPEGTPGGFETVVQATSGLLSTLIDADAPAAVGPPILEHLTAAYAVQAILATLLDPSAPRYVPVSMLHAGLTLMSEPLAVYETSGAVFRARSRPAYSQAYMFTCADGQLIAMHLSSADRNWDALMRVTGFPEPLRDPNRFGDRATRIAHFAEAQRILAPVFATRPSGDWLRELHAEGVSVAAVNAIDQLRDDPAIAALGVLGRTAPESTHGQQFTVVGAPGIGADPVEGPAPAIGEHTAEVLAELRTDA